VTLANVVAIMEAEDVVCKDSGVEDEPTLVETISYNLREEGYKVCTAMDGIAALDIVKQESPDLILLDVMLPGVDDWSLPPDTQRIRWPIVMLTAKARESIRSSDSSRRGRLHYKTIRMMELIARIRAALRRSRRESQSPEVYSAHGVNSISPGDCYVEDKPVSLRPKEFRASSHSHGHRAAHGAIVSA